MSRISNLCAFSSDPKEHTPRKTLLDENRIYSAKENTEKMNGASSISTEHWRRRLLPPILSAAFTYGSGEQSAWLPSSSSPEEAEEPNILCVSC